MIPDVPRPGDIILVSRWDPFAIAIKATQLLAGWPWSAARVNHWQVITATWPDGTVTIVEAAITGVRERRIRLPKDAVWVRPDYADQAAALNGVESWNGTPYGFADLPALLAEILGWRPAWAQRVLRRPTTIVCSQLGAFGAWTGDAPPVSEVTWPLYVPAMWTAFVPAAD